MAYSYALAYYHSKSRGIRSPARLASIHSLSPQLYKSIRLCFYTAVIFIFQITSTILIEKIYKTPYKNNQNPNITDSFNDPFGLSLCQNFFAMFYGFAKYQIATRNNTQYQDQEQVPTKRYLSISGINTLNSVLCNGVIILTSFTVFNLIHCCSLLSVVLIAVFCSKYLNVILGQQPQSQQQLRSRQVSSKQIFIALFVVVGIIIFNYHSKTQVNSVNKPFNMWSMLIIVVILFLQGLRPEVIMQVRQRYHPAPSRFYYQVAKLDFCLMLAISTVSTHLFNMAVFIWNHDDIALDLVIFSLVSVIAQIFIYRVLVLHKQHVIPFIITTRRILSSVINILWFHHHITGMQALGITIVGCGVFFQLLSSSIEIFKKTQNGQANQTKFQQIQEQIQEDTI